MIKIYFICLCLVVSGCTRKKKYRAPKLDISCEKVNPVITSKMQHSYTNWKIRSSLVDIKKYKKTKYALFKVWKDRDKLTTLNEYVQYENSCTKYYKDTSYVHSRYSQPLKPKLTSEEVIKRETLKGGMEKTKVRIDILDVNLNGVVTLDERGQFAFDLLKPSLSIKKIAPIEIAIELHGHEVSRIKVPQKPVAQVRAKALDADWKFIKPWTWGPRSMHWDHDQKKVLDTFDRVKPYIIINKDLSYSMKNNTSYHSMKIKRKPPSGFRALGRGARIFSGVGIVMEVLIQIAEDEEAKRLQKEWETLGFLDTSSLN